MKLALIAAAATLSQCVPASAKTQECFPAEQAAMELAAEGFEITFGDGSMEYPLFMAEDGTGQWVMFIVGEGIMCPLAAGTNGIHVPKKPNA